MKKEWCNISIWGKMFQLAIIVSIVVFLACVVVVVFSAAAVVGFTAHFTIAEESVRAAAAKYGLTLAFASLLSTLLNSQATFIAVCQTLATGPSSLHLTQTTIPDLNHVALVSSTNCTAWQLRFSGLNAVHAYHEKYYAGNDLAMMKVELVQFLKRQETSRSGSQLAV